MSSPGQVQRLVVTYYATPGGSAVDATDVTLTITTPGASYGPFTAVTREAPGRYSYAWQIPQDATLGVYTAEWSGVLPGQDDPSIGYESFTVTAAPSISTDLCWPVDTSAVNWPAPDPDGPTGVQLDLAQALASETMRMLSGYRLGSCPLTTRPVGQAWASSTWLPRGGPGWGPAVLEGEWINFGCSTHANGGGFCGCAWGREVWLGPDVGEVLEVRQDGVVLPPDAYRLSAGMLLRVDGLSWPRWQDVTADPAAPGSWTVTYRPGPPVDALGQQIAGILALEYVNGMVGNNCGLPDHVTQISRQGLTMEVSSGLFPDGLTGIREVDLYLRRVNPNALRAPSYAWSPDLPRTRA